ncbi:GATA zinc finger domain-containing protein 15-like [Condylostylus longicornis]|uniref:GATA zinc finger domain-containing protein 15-like n=1 Tax=Condylostylus longicornis TaxID=2530218 RepID=UPI00244E0252|nr:GATA zinc finger domain-containing protein 15-like [Condylostylus longicornis]
MPSVGSTPTTSPATSTLNASQNDQHSNNNSSIYSHCNHQYQNNSTSLANSTVTLLNNTTVLNDHSNNSSSTTSSSTSTPIHSPELQLSSTVSVDNNLQAITSIINRYSISSQITTVAASTTTVSAFITSPNNSLSPPSSGNQFNYNSSLNKNPFYSSNNSHQLPDSTKFLIITPAVSIDRDFDNDTGAPASEECTETYNYPSMNSTANSEFNSINNNTIEMTNITGNNCNLKSTNNFFNEQHSHYHNQHRQSFLSSNFRSKYNSIYSNQQMNEQQQKSQYNFLSKSANTLSGFTAATAPSSWRWCSLICAAMRCFGGGRNNTARSHYTSTFSARNYTQVKDDSASFGSGSRLSNPFSCIGAGVSDSNDSSINSGIKLNRNLKTSYQNNSSTMINGPFTTPRKTRDHMNNICYEL